MGHFSFLHLFTTFLVTYSKAILTLFENIFSWVNPNKILDLDPRTKKAGAIPALTDTELARANVLPEAGSEGNSVSDGTGRNAEDNKTNKQDEEKTGYETDVDEKGAAVNDDSTKDAQNAAENSSAQP